MIARQIGGSPVGRMRSGPGPRNHEDRARARPLLPGPDLTSRIKISKLEHSEFSPAGELQGLPVARSATEVIDGGPTAQARTV